MNYAKIFAENLIRQRKQRGLSQEQFAEELDVSRQAVSKWEAGINMPDIPKLIAIADKFGITIDSLLRSKSSDLKEKIGDINRSEASINIISEGKTFQVKTGSTVYIKNEYEYISKIKIAGIPLVHIHTGRSHQCARGIIAIGNNAFGVIAIGGFAAGLLSFGGMSLGLLFAFGGIAVGSVSFGGFSVGALAFGGCAVGMLAAGGLAVGKEFAIGGTSVAPVSIGTNIEASFRVTQDTAAETINRYIEENAPYIPAFLRRIFCLFK